MSLYDNSPLVQYVVEAAEASYVTVFHVVSNRLISGGWFEKRFYRQCFQTQFQGK